MLALGVGKFGVKLKDWGTRSERTAAEPHSSCACATRIAPRVAMNAAPRTTVLRPVNEADFFAFFISLSPFAPM